MLKSMLVGLDGSAYSAAAVELGVRWAGQHQALLVGLGVIDEPAIRGDEAVPLGADHYKQKADEARMHRARLRIEQLLEAFSLRCAQASVASKVLEDQGAPADRLMLQAQRVDLVLLGMKTYFQFATQDEPCETLHRVLKNTPRPVVAVPEKAPDGNAIVVAYDGSLQAARALQAFVGVGPAANAEIHLVSVAETKTDAARPADRAAEFLGFHEIKAQVHTVASNRKVADVLLEEIRKRKAGLVVMGAYGQPALREFFLGSVTRRLLEEGTTPLFLYH